MTMNAYSKDLEAEEGQLDKINIVNHIFSWQ